MTLLGEPVTRSQICNIFEESYRYQESHRNALPVPCSFSITNCNMNPECSDNQILCRKIQAKKICLTTCGWM